MSRKLILALAILALTTTPALARGGGGFHGGGAFQGSGGSHGGRFGRPEHFNRFGFFGFYGPSFYYPYPYYAYPYPVYSAPAVVEPPPMVIQQPPVQREVVYPNGRYVLYGDGVNQPYQWVWREATQPVSVPAPTG
jgi:hypothetical protein